MSASEIASAVFLLAGVTVMLASCVGVAVMPSVYERLHFVTPAAVVAPAAVAVGVLLRESFNTRGIKAVIAAAALATLNPILSHATARASRISRFGDWRPRAGEISKK